ALDTARLQRLYMDAQQTVFLDNEQVQHMACPYFLDQKNNVRFDIFGNRATVGRGSDNNIVITELGISRHHATIQRGADSWILTDCGSTNGTAINGVLISQNSVYDNDIVSFANTQLLFKEA
ncbi:MAG: FHA domain-containing protein, partial [Coriobacteriales bacterium]|nr:FHA domain-containing protein [Coriobacteriales bacterium]